MPKPLSFNTVRPRPSAAAQAQASAAASANFSRLLCASFAAALVASAILVLAASAPSASIASSASIIGGSGGGGGGGDAPAPAHAPPPLERAPADDAGASAPRPVLPADVARVEERYAAAADAALRVQGPAPSMGALRQKPRGGGGGGGGSGGRRAAATLPPPPPPRPQPQPQAPRAPPPPASVEGARVAMLREMTRQCGRVYFDVLPQPAVVLREVDVERECPDLQGSVMAATRERWMEEGEEEDWSFDKPAKPLNVPNCRLRWFAPHEACDLIESLGNFVMIGDSLVRALTTALFTIMSNNYRFGGTRNAAELPVVWKQCGCEDAYGGNSLCHGAPAMMAEWKGDQGIVCPRWKRRHLHFLPFWGVREYREEELEDILDSAPRSVIYDAVGLGFADELPNHELIKRTHFDVTFRHAAAHGNTRLICGTVLKGDGDRRPERWRLVQSDGNLSEHNAFVRDLCARSGHELFDGFALTHNVWSHDATHYQSKDYVQVAQILLNFLARNDSRGSPGSADGRAPVAQQPPEVLEDMRARKAARRREKREALRRARREWQVERGASADFGQFRGGHYKAVLPGFRLQTCECLADWQALQAADAGAAVCACDGVLCPARVNPPLLESGDGNWAFTPEQAHVMWCSARCAPRADGKGDGAEEDDQAQRSRVMWHSSSSWPAALIGDDSTSA
jgi:hypothetical protein